MPSLSYSRDTLSSELQRLRYSYAICYTRQIASDIIKDYIMAVLQVPLRRDVGVALRPKSAINLRVKARAT